MTQKFKGLFIDIDDTLLRFKDTRGDTSSLMSILKDAGVELANLDRKESEYRVNWVNENVTWWSWDHFIEMLEIDPEIFWNYAYEKESVYLEPTEARLPCSLRRLKDCGLNLFITSNNPNSGIRHKLRLAGLTNNDIDELFTALLGATEMQNMKGDPGFWNKAVRESGMKMETIAVVGDNLNDDHDIPTSVGLPFTFLIDPEKKQSETDKLKPVTGLKEVADLFEAHS